MVIIHKVKIPKLTNFIMINVHNDKSTQSRYKMVIMSKFDMHKLSDRVCRAPSSSLAACPERRYHSGYKDLSIGVGVEVWAGSQAECHVTENFQPRPKKVS
jgi:hypothetical protein